MDGKMTTLEIIGLAVKSEQDASDFYKKVAGAIKNEVVKIKYENLSREELGHKALLKGLYSKLTGGGALPKDIKGAPLTAESGFPVAVTDLEGALLLAISREQEANRFYLNAATRTDDQSACRILQYLADMEKGHELTLSGELESFRRDRDWYANNPEIQLLG